MLRVKDGLRVRIGIGLALGRTIQIHWLGIAGIGSDPMLTMLIWHITHRCHKQEFLFKFAKDRQRWMGWLFEAKKRFGLKILDFVESGIHLFQCLVYIDLNMVRAGAIDHPQEWSFSGYHEIQNPRKRYGMIDHERLIALVEAKNQDDLKKIHKEWIEEKLNIGNPFKEDQWTESVAVGGEEFVKGNKRWVRDQGSWENDNNGWRAASAPGSSTAL